MNLQPRQVRATRSSWALAALCVPMVLLLIEVVRGATQETRLAGTQTIRAALHELQLTAAVRAKELEVLLRAQTSETQSLLDATKDGSLLNAWSEVTAENFDRQYAAVVDAHNVVVLHTNPAHVGEKLDGAWYDRRLPEYGNNVALIRGSSVENALSGQQSVYDVSIPVETTAGRAAYHEAVDADSLDASAAQMQRSTLGRWLVVLGLAGIAEVGACWSLVHLARHQWQLRKHLSAKSQERARELSQIGSGLAHEVRNPLHALRINLHTLRRAQSGRSALPPDQLLASIDESDAAIDRLDGLMRDFLQYSDRTTGQKKSIDLIQEVQATVRLLAEDFRRSQIAVHEHFSAEPLSIVIDPHRLRQALLNLLTFAQHRIGKAGVIELTIQPCRDGAELAVKDSGPLLGEKQRRQLFEPFQAPAETGSGLGLALVQVFVEEVGGRVSCDGVGTAQGLCRVWFPLECPVSKGVGRS